MIRLDTAVARLPIVLVVDPVAASRLAMWRLLSRSFGVLEAPGARRAEEWLARRPDIAPLVAPRGLPDADGGGVGSSLVSARVDGASRSILVGRPVDLRRVLTDLTGWFFSQDVRKADALRRQADRLVS